MTATAIERPPYRVPSMEEIAAVRGTNGLCVVSTFSGCGGSCLGFEMAGYEVLWASEFVPAARDVYRLNHPDVHLDERDIREVKPEDVLATIGKEVGEVDVLEGSPPCFVAGTPVVTARGVLAIEAVRVGDEVLTGRGRWRRVEATMSREAEVVRVGTGDLRATPDHPFLSRPQHRRATGERYRPDPSHPRASQVVRWGLGPAAWTPAADLRGRFAALPAVVDPLPVPSLAKVEMGEAFWRFVGRWLGDGWLRIDDGDRDLPWKKRTLLSRLPRDCPVCEAPAARSKRYPHLFGLYCGPRCKRRAADARRRRPRYEVMVCCSHPEADKLALDLAATGLRWSRSDQASTVRFATSGRELALWLRDNFGRGAAGKTLPGWLLGAEEPIRGTVLEGYLAADGHEVESGWIASSVSRPLAVGVRLLATTLGFTTSFGLRAQNASTIEGRAVKTRPSWHVSIRRDDGRYTRLDDGHRWVKVRRDAEPAGFATVYDLTVEEDHSFVADGFVVHNCAAFSTAGRREEHWGQVRKYSDVSQRTDDLFFEFVRLLGGIRPKVFVAENVSGLVKGAAKGYFKEIHTAMAAQGYVVKARLLDAQWLGVPQARKRVIFVGVRDDLGVQPAFPTPLPYRYTIRDALPWLGSAKAASHGPHSWPNDALTAEEPAPTVPTGPAGGSYVEVVQERYMPGGEEPRERRMSVDDPASTVSAEGYANGFSHQTHIEVLLRSMSNGRWGTKGMGDPVPVDEVPAPTVDSGGIAGGEYALEAKIVHDTSGLFSQGEVSDQPIPTIMATPADARHYQVHGGERLTHDPETGHKITIDGMAVGREYDKLRPGETSDRYFNLVKPSEDAPVPTVTQMGGNVGMASVTHPVERRKFAITELRRLCGFPDDFELTGSYQQRWERLGRAVPPPMMMAVAEVIRDEVLAKVRP